MILILSSILGFYITIQKKINLYFKNRAKRSKILNSIINLF